MNLIFRKCKTLSTQLGPRSTSSTSSEHQRRSADTGAIMWKDNATINYSGGEQHNKGTVFVGSNRKRYVIDFKFLNHPLVKALIKKSSSGDDDDNAMLVINCEVVLFDHLLWMLDQDTDLNLSSDSLDELADLYYLY
ncbi:hypothetical protein QVD17_27096 [Tagetes erecta]|uniref:Uncharacterized protein n=1 Tax=Tagetes erecta TaxID=13708 RepID=A0AAD8NJ33_TARER|nr:hypothetical protein QVD17_27096 [Tagetes erecta]